MTDTSERESIPQLLRAFPRWCRWTLRPNPGGRPTKQPDQSTRELHRCRPWDRVEHVLRWEEEGIGFVTTGGLPVRMPDGSAAFLLLVDVDACVAYALAPWAVKLLELCGNSYAEFSPSGTGIRIAILVRSIPTMRATVRVPHPAPNGVDKQPAIQFFGLGAAGYVTMTGRQVSGTSAEPRLVDLAPIIKEFGLEKEEDTPDVEVGAMKGHGEPPPFEEIERKVRGTKHGDALLKGDWKRVFPDKSASEAWSVLVRETLEATNGNGPAAVNFLLTRTAWGKGDIDDSADPDKYARRSWVEGDVARCAKKGGGASVIDEFEALPDASPGVAAAAKPIPGDPMAVFDFWQHEGPLVRLPTGIKALDDMTGGGLVLGSRVYMVGAPNAGKTALMMQLADVFAMRGIPVGVLGIDEEASDLATRQLQRRGFSRESCERRDPLTLEAARAAFASLPMRLFDPSMAIEEAAVALHRFACERFPGVDRPPCVLFIDSVQVARCMGEKDDENTYRAVTRRVAAIRAAASRYRMLVVATSEMSRAAYKAKRVEDQVTDMASAKESGAIEFSARVLLALRSVPLDSDHVELRVAKNKHGRDHRPDEDGIFLRVDRARQTLSEDADFRPLDVEDVRQNEKDQRMVSDAAALAELLGEGPKNYRQACAALAPNVPESRVRAAKSWLTEVGAILEVPGARNSKDMRLDGNKLPESVVAALGRRMFGL
jgi:KaiC/GvpD/RAD55 family RecA-like ATPase